MSLMVSILFYLWTKIYDTVHTVTTLWAGFQRKWDLIPGSCTNFSLLHSIPQSRSI